MSYHMQGWQWHREIPGTLKQGYLQPLTSLGYIKTEDKELTV